MEDMPLYHIFKLIILLFGFIMMFDTSMFLLSFDTDWAQTTLVENTGLNAVYHHNTFGVKLDLVCHVIYPTHC